MKSKIFVLVCIIQLYTSTTALPKTNKEEINYKALAEKFEQENEELRNEMRTMTETLQKQMTQVLQRMEEDKTTKASQAETDAKQNHLIQDLVRDVTKHSPTPDITNTETLHACLFDLIVIQCQPSETVFITEAFYGAYASTCSDECCAPDDVNDCRVSISEENSDEWLTIRSNCNYESECVHQYQGHELSGCENIFADYLELTYTCASGVSQPPETVELPLVMFTAYDTSTYRYQSSGQIIYFPFVSSNIGNAYDAYTYKFTCPYDGIYVFHFHIQADSSDYLAAYLTKDDESIVGAYADYVHASNTAYVECAVGSEVWVECAVPGYTDGGYRAMTFSGQFLGFSNATSSSTFGYDDI